MLLVPCWAVTVLLLGASDIEMAHGTALNGNQCHNTVEQRTSSGSHDHRKDRQCLSEGLHKPCLRSVVWSKRKGSE